MSDEEEGPQEEQKKGAPLWVVTFSDLMSLLLAFFVLLFSFSEVDNAKYKQVGGSMHEAFGVQDKLKVREAVKGINHIAQEFSAGRPDINTLNVVESLEIQQLLRYLTVHTTEEETEEAREAAMRAIEQMPDGAAKEAALQAMEFIREGKVVEAAMAAMKAMIAMRLEEEAKKKKKGKSKKKVELAATGRGEGDPKGNSKFKAKGGIDGVKKTDGVFATKFGSKADGRGGRNSGFDKWGTEAEVVQDLKKRTGKSDEMGEPSKKIGGAAEKEGASGGKAGGAKKAVVSAAIKLKADLAKAIQAGVVEVKRSEGSKLLIRLNNETVFAPGSAKLLSGQEILILKIAKALQSVRGRVVVSGHTDNTPISNARFRSNWELSSSRAVSMVHALMRASGLPPTSFRVEGYGDTRPIFPNVTPEGRRKNRRVEIQIETDDAEQVMKALSADKSLGAKVANQEIPLPKPKVTPDPALEEEEEEEEADVPFEEQVDEFVGMFPNSSTVEKSLGIIFWED